MSEPYVLRCYYCGVNKTVSLQRGQNFVDFIRIVAEVFKIPSALKSRLSVYDYFNVCLSQYNFLQSVEMYATNKTILRVHIKEEQSTNMNPPKNSPKNPRKRTKIMPTPVFRQNCFYYSDTDELPPEIMLLQSSSNVPKKSESSSEDTRKKEF